MSAHGRFKFATLALGVMLAALAAVEANGQPRATSPVNDPSPSPLPAVVGGYPTALPLCAIGPDLQQCLDANTAIRLEGGDYRTQNRFALLVKSGQQLYGLPGTYVPEIRIQSGTEKVVLSTINSNKVNFVRSSTNDAIRFNVFIRVNASFNDLGSVVESNVFTYCNGTLHIDNRASGYLRNNRFIGSHAHAQSDMITVMGDKQGLSYGNTFLWYNFLTPHGRTTLINNQKDISFVGIDAEGWNETGEDSTWAPMLDFDKTSTVRVFAANGGNGGLNPTPYIRANADQVQILDMNSTSQPITPGSKSAAGSPWNPTSPNLLNTIFLGADNRLSWIGNFCCVSSVSFPAPGLHFEIFQSGKGAFKINGVASDDYADVTDNALHQLFAPENRPGTPWEEAVFRPLPDPAGANWKASVSTAVQKGTDDSARIQNMIDSSPTGVALLPAGTYYIAKSLVLGKNKGLIGAGMDKTLILALSPSLNMIVPGDSAHPNSGGNQKFILSDLTLQGGRSGVFHSADNTGPYTQLTEVFLSYVQFREMNLAGILFQDIYGWDNNLLDHLGFVNCETGFKQSFPSVPKSGENSDNNYMDKTIFYKVQFVGNKLGVDLPAYRPDNLNAFIYSLFENNLNGAAFLQNALTTVFAGSQFIDNGGSAVVQLSNSFHTSFASCQFTAGSKGKFFFSQSVNVEGARFSQGIGGNAKVFKDGASVTVYNSLSDVPLGKVVQGVFVNSKFPDAGHDRFFILKNGGDVVLKSSDYSTPEGQLLWGSHL
jgi:hypothetical protein